MLTVVEQADELKGALSGELSIFNAQALHEALLPWLQRQQALTLDLSQVTQIDSSILQILMQARRHLKAQGLELNLVQHSAVVISALETLGLVQWFADPVVLSAAGAQA